MMGNGVEAYVFRRPKLYLLNTPILTSFGTWRYSALSVDAAKALLRGPFESAIGHELTAKLMTELLGVEIPVNRQAVKMVTGDKAIVYRLKVRLPEGTVIHSIRELAELSEDDRNLWELGFLEAVEVEVGQ